MTCIYKATLTILLTATFASCTSPPDFSKVCVGDPKSKVVGAFGKPKRVAATGAFERLSYEWDDASDGRWYGKWAHVDFRDGRVIGYGVDSSASTGFNVAAVASNLNAQIQQDQAQQSQQAHERYLESQRGLNRSIERMTPQRVDVYVH